jgi:hypothetical protein
MILYANSAPQLLSFCLSCAQVVDYFLLLNVNTFTFKNISFHIVPITLLGVWNHERPKMYPHIHTMYFNLTG